MGGGGGGDIIISASNGLQFTWRQVRAAQNQLHPGSLLPAGWPSSLSLSLSQLWF